MSEITLGDEAPYLNGETVHRSDWIIARNKHFQAGGEVVRLMPMMGRFAVRLDPSSPVLARHPPQLSPGATGDLLIVDCHAGT